MIHGGDVITYKNEFAGEIIDFSSNINPLGPPKALQGILNEAYKELLAYPDINYRELKENVSAYLGCGKGEIIVGSGAIEIINNMCLLFNRIVVFTPCFSEYIKRPIIMGKEIYKIPLGNDFEIKTELLEVTLKKGDLLILGNPNNPTGLRIPKDTLKKIHEIIKKKGAFLLLDEAFYEFCPTDYDSVELFRGEDSVVVIRAATKFFALPGIRLGYAFAPTCFVKQYEDIEIPWSINSFANAAARCIFKDQNYIKNTREYIGKEREKLLNDLGQIKWLEVYKSHVNFILIKLLKYEEEYVFNQFIKRGIMLRKASSFEGLDKQYIRIAVKDSYSNQRLLEAFKDISQNPSFKEK